MTEDLERWWSAGERLELTLGGQRRRVFVAHGGSGPAVTALHGFPSSSHDWARLAPELSRTQALLAPDFLGYGASEKPCAHRYSIHEQADLVERVWQANGVRSTTLIAHDYGVSVAQELLARRLEGRLAVDLDGLLLLNGGLYPELHRPQPTQLALLDPEQGPKLSELIGEEAFTASLAPTFAPTYDAAADSACIWQAMSHEAGQRNAHLLIRYIDDRREHAQRWTDALEQTDVPLSFVWGMLDPVSGAHMAQRLRERLPDAPFLALDDVGHWPPLEAPQRVLEGLLRIRR